MHCNHNKLVINWVLGVISMTIKQLEYFMEVARQLSFSKAAENLYVSQSALSRSVSALEEELGSILFFRNKHAVALTPAGMTLASRIPQLSAELARTVNLVRQAEEGMRGRLTIGIQSGLQLPEVVKSAIKYFLTSLPFISITPVRIEHGDLTDALSDGRIDFGLAYTPEGSTPPPYVSSIIVSKQPICVAAAESAGLGDLVSPEQLKDRRFIFSGDEQSLTALRWQEFCRSRGIEPECIYCENTETRITMIAFGMGLGVFPSHHRAFVTPDIKRISLEPSYNACCALVWNSGNLNPSVEVFEKVIKGDM